MRSAIVAEFGPEYSDVDPLVTPATKAAFGDYQCNAAMSLGKAVGRKPREVAEQLVAAAQLAGVCEVPEIAGPGFLNIRLREDALAERVQAVLADPERLALPRKTAQRIVVDYSSPNIAKEMHVGHLRSTVIGDALARLLELQGHAVVRLNHVGDWGTQFGMLITHLREVRPEAVGAADGSADGLGSLEIGDLVTFYKAAKRRFDEDEAFQTASRAAVVALQVGDEACLKAWRALCSKSRDEFGQIYKTLGVDARLEERGESFYNPGLGAVVQRLDAAGVLVASAGARVVYPEGAEPSAATDEKNDGPPPLIVVKSDGGYMYSTTDLAAIVHRVAEERAERVLYVTDSGQSLHFSRVFDAARRAELAPASVTLEHVPFGLVLGEDGKKFKTRSGETVRLADLLLEAVRIAKEDLLKRAEERGEGVEGVDALASSIGISAVKYADLSMNRNSNYRFSYAKMLALTGNTAPYMLYAYARIAGIQRKARASGGGSEGPAGAAVPAILLGTAEERALAMHLLRLPEVLDQVEGDLLPHRLCDYAYELSGKFNQFYESCPVNNAPSAELRESRVALCTVTASTLRLVLSVLGIPTLEKL
ncbi:Arginyl-tRNA synthetase [Pavlovales sp. CCMP2436]|nr:Arginyl-tRNA synthetase [Pavlovales sp. CCMP2436]|eukprot:CAMPEP_0180064218 /NCGR_PEP_ID=MMETSP0985-20121206/8059_1 /TAXON_ID=483367 /ORGANISM="non described non described, Strain CCMP 2436" /LENGTH=593 /DNA_ID=CAMNT_0021994495 /DNA_START=1 /DNA_END=1782 /DNA_ORIENTATION=+